MSIRIPEEFAANPLPAYLNAEDREVLDLLDNRRGRGGADAMPGSTLFLRGQKKLMEMQASQSQSLDLTLARRAMSWLHEAAVRGLASAAYNLGNFYMGGEAGLLDERAAAFWYDRAIEWCGDNPPDGVLHDFDELNPGHDAETRRMAMVNLGNLFQQGQSHERDLARALALYRTAAELDEPMAQWNVFAMLSTGQGLEDDGTDESLIDEAMRNLDRAAANGMERAVETMGHYRKARDVSEEHGRCWTLVQMWNGSRFARIDLVHMLLDPESAVRDRGEALRRIKRLSQAGDREALKTLVGEMIRWGDDRIAAIGRKIRDGGTPGADFGDNGGRCGRDPQDGPD